MRQVFTAIQLQNIVRQMCEGLLFMKKRVVIHCDMKPENVLFTDDTYQNIKIIDFGASCKSCSTGFFYV